MDILVIIGMRKITIGIILFGKILTKMIFICMTVIIIIFDKIGCVSISVIAIIDVIRKIIIILLIIIVAKLMISVMKIINVAADTRNIIIIITNVYRKGFRSYFIN